MNTLPAPDTALIADLRQLIDGARLRAAVAVNSELTLLYWQVGRRIHTEILGSQRAEYGEEIVSALSRQLTADYGRGFQPRACATWCALPKPLPMRRLSLRCRDN